MKIYFTIEQLNAEANQDPVLFKDDSLHNTRLEYIRLTNETNKVLVLYKYLENQFEEDEMLNVICHNA